MKLHLPPVRFSRKYIGIFVIFSLLMMSFGLLYYSYQKKRIMKEQYTGLQTIASLRISQIQRWKNERLADAEIIRKNPIIAEYAQQFLNQPKNKTVRNNFVSYFDALNTYNDYDSAWFVDNSGTVRLNRNSSGANTIVDLTLVIEAMKKKQVVLSDFYKNDNGAGVHLILIAPLVLGNGRLAGAIALQVNPERTLFPRIEPWPTPSPSGETLLVRKDGEDVLFLNELRHKKNTALTLRLPLATPGLAAAAAILGKEGLFEGVDYRGKPVLADIRPVPGTPWFMVAKIETAEIFAPLQRQALYIILIVALTIILTGTALLLVWRQEKLRFYQEKYKISEELRSLSQRQEALLAAVPDIIAEVDENKTYTWANPAALSFFGDDMIGKEADFYFEGEQKTYDIVAPIFHGKENVIYLESWQRRKDGQKRLLAWWCRVLKDSNGNVSGALSSARDITERKIAEEKLEKAMQHLSAHIDNSPLAVIEFDPQFRVIRWSKEAEKIFGWAADEVVGRSIGEMQWVYEEDAAIVQEESAGLFTGERARSVNINRNYRKDGLVIYCEWYSSAIHDSQGRLVSVLSLVLDITGRKKALEALGEKTAQLEELNQTLEKRVEKEVALRLKNEQLLIQQSKMAAMGEMLGAIAHQWRQPLNVLGLCIQNLKNAYTMSKFDKGYLEKTVVKSLDQINHMSKTIDDFRNFFKPDKEKTIFDAMLAVSNVISLLSAQLGSEFISYRIVCRAHGTTTETVSDFIPCPDKKVLGFRNEFEHVLLNLMSNAKDGIIERRKRGLMERGETGSIIFEFDNEGDMVIIKVMDNGIGIPAEIQDRIFEPYFTTKDKTQGTGIGLYMSKIIIEEHMQGALNIEAVEKGACFIIRLKSCDEEQKEA